MAMKIDDGQMNEKLDGEDARGEEEGGVMVAQRREGEAIEDTPTNDL